MILGMKKGSTTADQSKRRTTNRTLMLFSFSRYHRQGKLSIEKCSLCGGEERLIGRVCEGCLIMDRQSGAGKVLRIITEPGESFC